MLIVVGIIAILASMLLPALNKAKRVAYLSSCYNNQKQLYIVMAQYDLDYGMLPLLEVNVAGCQPKWDVAGWNGWGMLYKTAYIKNGHTFFGPSPSNLVRTPAD